MFGRPFSILLKKKLHSEKVKPLQSSFTWYQYVGRVLLQTFTAKTSTNYKSLVSLVYVRGAYTLALIHNGDRITHFTRAYCKRVTNESEQGKLWPRYYTPLRLSTVFFCVFFFLNTIPNRIIPKFSQFLSGLILRRMHFDPFKRRAVSHGRNLS